MPTPSECMDIAASAMNDTAQENYTDEALLPYFNMAIRELMMRMEEAGLPVTQRTSVEIDIPAGTTEITFGTVAPVIPSDLIEIDEIWETNDGGLSWTPVARRDYIDPNIAENQNLSIFGIYSWQGSSLFFPEATGNITIKLWYIKKIVTTPITIGDIDTQFTILNSEQYLGFKTAAYVAMLIAQDTERASVCENQANNALETQMGIVTKAQQNIPTRRKPFRSGWKSYGRGW